ncbi:MAG: hypothetical protein KDC44_12995, partial [Phaeodactylibacter sp.]|nr:hypothetical protein [Phaeodactylibacter sp.]
MRKTTGCWWMGLLMLLTCSLFGQTEVLQIKIYGFEEGLSHRNVYKIQQDTYGFIWLSTINGLNKYDGYQFARMGDINYPFELPEGFVTDMVIDSLNTIWLVAPNYLHEVEPATGKIRSIRVNDGSLTRGEEQAINALHIDPAGNAWSATYRERQGLSFLQKYSKGKKVFEYQLPGTYEHRPILSWRDTLYVGAYENELWQFDLEGRLIDKYTFSFRGYSQASARIRDLKTDENGRLFVLLQNGTVYYREAGSAEFVRHPISSFFKSGDTNVSTFLPEANGDIWLAGEEVLWYYNKRTDQLKDVNKDVQEISRFDLGYRQLFKDQAGVIWIASEFGAIKIVRSRELFTTYLNGGNSFCSGGFCSIRGITEANDRQIYISYYNSIHQLNPETGQLRPLFPFTEFVIPPFGLAAYAGALYTGDGLRIDLQTKAVDSLLQEVEKGVEGIPLLDPNQQLWLAHGNHLYQLAEQKQRFIPYKDKNGLLQNFPFTFTSIHHGQRSGYLWLGTKENGIYFIDLATGECAPLFTAEQLETQLSHPRILAIYEDKNGILWLGTEEGMTKIDLVNQTASHVMERDGLPNNFINGILPEGDSALWISTDNGMARYFLRNGRITTFYKRDGLPANEFNRISYYKSKDGRLYFGGLNGVT